MTYEPFAAAHGPRRPGRPAGGVESAIATGRRRLRRRRAVAGATSVASVALLGTAVVAVGRDGANELRPAAGGQIARRMVHDPAACTGRQELVPPFAADAGYCVFLTGPTVVTPGIPAVYTFRLCRRTGAGTDVLGLSADDEFTAGVRPFAAGASVYGWGRPTEHRWHDVVFGDGECREWSFRWDGRDRAGHAVPSGRYVVGGMTAQVAWDPDQKPVGLGYARADLDVTVLSAP